MKTFINIVATVLFGANVAAYIAGSGNNVFLFLALGSAVLAFLTIDKKGEKEEREEELRWNGKNKSWKN